MALCQTFLHQVMSFGLSAAATAFLALVNEVGNHLQATIVHTDDALVSSDCLVDHINRLC